MTNAACLFRERLLWYPQSPPISDKIRIINLQVLWANDPYKALKTTLKAEIDEVARATLHSDI